METMQHYVPMAECFNKFSIPSLNKTVELHTARAHCIEFAGDQKTAARGRGAQKAINSSPSPMKRLTGLIPVAVDWHTKVKLLDVSIYIYTLN